MKILLTGAAGFIGFHVAKKLINLGANVIGVDNLTPYYDVNLKNDRLAILEKFKNFLFYPFDIAHKSEMDELYSTHPDIEYVIHLAAQPGVRYSIDHPEAYLHSNLAGHLNMLELCRKLQKLKHFVYASSSSVYGANKKVPFAESDRTDDPVSLYAATKKSCELMSHCYSNLYKIPSTGLRFFTVYGPWGRPDMAPFLFTDAILKGETIKLFNHGKLRRDFTYIDDIVSAVVKIINIIPDAPQIYNLGNNKPVEVSRFIEIIENLTGKKAIIEMYPMQKGDVEETHADITKAHDSFGFQPTTNLEVGMESFIKWFVEYYKL